MAKTLLEKTKELILKTTGEFTPKDIKLLGSKSVRTRAIKALLEEGVLTKVRPGVYILAENEEVEEVAEEEVEEVAAKKKKKKKSKKKAKKKAGYKVFLNGEFLMNCNSDEIVREQFHNHDVEVQGDEIFITSRSGDKG